jgi:hypothetical protein
LSIQSQQLRYSHKHVLFNLFSEDKHVEPGTDVQRLCEITLTELLVHDQSTDKVSRDAMVALEQISAHRHGTVADRSILDVAPLVEPATSDIVTASNGGQEDVLARKQPFYMGSVSAAIFIEALASKKPYNSKFTKKQITNIFAAFSSRELKLHGLELLGGTSQARYILRSPILQHKVRIGRTKLVDFLKSVKFEDDAAKIDAVAAACVQAAKAEKAFQRSGVGKEVARVLGRLE